METGWRTGIRLIKTPLDGIELGNPVMMERQKWADDMAMDRSRLPSDAHGVGIYSSHWNDNNGFTWQGNDALIAQDVALRAARFSLAGVCCVLA